MTHFLNPNALQIAAVAILAGLAAVLVMTLAANLAARRKQEAWAVGYRRFRLPVVLAICSAIVDDFLDAGGYKDVWWNDEFLAVVRTLTVLSWTWSLSSVLKFAAAGMIEKRNNDPGATWTFKLISNGIIGLLWLGSVFMLLKVWGISPAPFMASAGMLTVAVSFFSKYLSGLSVYLNRPYAIGDYLVLPTGERGEVARIGIANTHIRTRDDTHIIVPNYIMSDSRLVNENAHVPHSRVRCQVGVAYDSDPDHVEKVLLESLAGNEFVILEPAPRVRFRSFGDTAIQVELLAWIDDPGNRGKALDIMIRNIHRACREAGIELPSPKMELVVKSDSPKLGKETGVAFHVPSGES